jgi:hypothetical protein
MEVKNLYVNIEDGDSCLVYTHELTEDEVKQLVEKVTGETVTEVYHVPQDELQYYCIDDRCWLDTPEKVAKVRAYLAA